MADTPERFEPNDYVGLIRDALHPDERKFFKSYLGQESPDFLDYIVPDTSRLKRFDEARKVRAHIYESVISESMKPRATVDEAQGLYPGFPTPPNARTPGAMQPGGELQGPGAPVPVSPGQPQAPIPQLSPQDVPAILPGTASPSFSGNYNMGPDQSGWAPKQGAGYQGQLTPGAVSPMREGPRPTAPPTMGPSGVDPNALLPRVYQDRLNAMTHRESLRGLYGGRGSATTQLNDHYTALMSGQKEEAFPGETEHIYRLLTSTRTTPEGSVEGQNKQADLDKKKAVLPYAGKQAAATLEGTQARTADTQANTETENLLRDARYGNLLARTKKAEKEAELAGNMSGSEIMKQKGIMLNLLKYGVAQGEFDLNDEKEFMNYIMGGTGIEIGAEPPGKFRAFMEKLGLVEPGGGGLKVTPGQGAAPGKSKSQSFEGAPAGKAVGDILKDGGKPVAKWNGKAWQPITQ